MRRLAVAATAAAAVASGCGGGGGGEAAETHAERPPAVAAPQGRPDPAPARVLARFVRAADRGDAAAMWALLTSETRATLGPAAAFRAGTARDLAELLRDFDVRRVVVSRTFDGGRTGVAALAGDRTVEGERDPFAYAGALERERGAWKLELGGAMIDALEPEPYEPTDARPLVRARANVAEPVDALAVWLDGRPLRPAKVERTPFTLSVSARPSRPLRDGRHDAVAFVATDGAAAAVAWPFTVED